MFVLNLVVTILLVGGSGPSPFATLTRVAPFADRASCEEAGRLQGLRIAGHWREEFKRLETPWTLYGVEVKCEPAGQPV